MKILVFGAGNIGKAIVYDLIQDSKLTKLGIVDIDKQKLMELSERFRDNRIQVYLENIFNLSKISEITREYDIISSVVPGSIGKQALTVAISSKKHIIDTSYMPEDPFIFDNQAKTSGIIIVPDCGVAPGLSNLLVGFATSFFSYINKVEIIVGGLPMDPMPPLYYRCTWSINDLFEEYLRPARYILNGKLQSVNPLDTIETLQLQPFGTFEAIITDGLRTLLRTIQAKNMIEKTIRYPGHLSKIKILRDLGFFSQKVILIDNMKIIPYKFTVAVLEDVMISHDVRDVLIMRVNIEGSRNNEIKTLQFDVYDEYDDSTNLTAMARTTGFTNALITRVIYRDSKALEKGVIPVEILGKNDAIFDFVINELKRRGISISKKIV